MAAEELLLENKMSIKHASHLKNVRIGTKISVGYLIMILMMITVTVTSAIRLTRLGEEAEAITGVYTERNQLAQQWKANVLANTTRMMAIAKSSDGYLAEFFKEAIEQASAEAVTLQDRLTAIETTEEGKKLLEKVQMRNKLWSAARDKLMLAKTSQADEDAIRSANQQVVLTTSGYMQAIDFLSKYEQQSLREVSDAIKKSVAATRLFVIAVSLIGIVLAMVFAWSISRSIVRPLLRAVGFAKQVASGDLTAEIDVRSADETGQLMQALHEMNDKLAGIVGEVRSGTVLIAHASGEIAAGNADLSARTESQASSLQETASSMEELTSTVRQNADSARQANQLAQSASEVALKGGAVVAQVVETMGSINQSSNKIVDIISVIDGIAFQTNILALNAAVEAARAGEQGRGFAVVAAEVRSLAQRSATAAKEIKGLIGDSVEKVNVGSKLVNQAGITMDEIVSSIKRVTDIMVEITSASQEQSAGIEQVNSVIAQMDDVTQKNSALVEEAAATAESMRNQADNLAQLVSQFKLDASVAATSMPAALPAKPSARLSQEAAPTSRKPAAQSSSANPSARLNKIAVADGSQDEWEEF
jgi:methyl-accepting chemotaxis protein